MKNKIILLVTFLFMLNSSLIANTFGAYQENKKGITAYENKNYKQSLEHFGNALEKNGQNSSLLYNIGNVHQQNKAYDEAIKSYESAMPKLSKSNQAKALYNLGNAHFNKKDYGSAIKSYIQALKLNPKDINSKKNLELSLAYQQLEKQKKQEKQKQDKQEDKQENKQKEEKSPKEKAKENEKQQAKNFLNTLDEQEKEALKKYKQGKAQVISDYDW
eukprot:COSAG01_NODE_7_length_54400_cov_1218.054935_35_plen_217_part_00